MTRSPTITRWLESHRRLSVEAEACHDSQAVAVGILLEFDAMSSEEREAIFPLLAEWLVSDDNRLRYDAAFVISERKVRKMLPAVLIALDKCERTTGPEAHYEAKKLRRIIDELGAPID